MGRAHCRAQDASGQDIPRADRDRRRRSLGAIANPRSERRRWRNAAREASSGQKNCWLEIILDEGKNRQIRRMLAARSVEILRLVRVAIGPLQLGNLPKGTFRPLTHDEKRSLDGAMLANEARHNATSASKQR